MKNQTLDQAMDDFFDTSSVLDGGEFQREPDHEFYSSKNSQKKEHLTFEDSMQDL